MKETTAMNTSISQVLQTLHHAVNNGDYEALSNCYDNSAKVVTTPLSGAYKTATSQHDCVYALQQFQQKFMPEHLVTTGDEIVIEAGDVALVIAKLYLVPKATPNALPCEGKKALYVMQKQSSGEWRCIIDNFFGTDLLDFA
jgi:ketosteroid isomerase-like protein